jgi:multiple sugar transport system substrate-binding protein
LAPVPRVRDNKTALYNGTWFIAKDSKHKDEAWTFVKYLLTEEAARDMSVATGFLVPHRATVDDWIELFVEPTGMDVASLLQVITQYPENCVENTNHLFVDWPQINTTLTQGLDALWLGKVDAETAISEVKPRVDQIIARTYEKYKDR